jgi:hypothetical protein
MTERTTPATVRGLVPRLSLPALWACLAVLLPVLGALLAPISTVDLAYGVRAGGIVLDSRALPSPDPFTFTAAGLAWLDQQWAAQAIFAVLFRAGGWALLAIVRTALVGLVAWLVFRASRSSGAGTRLAASLTLAGFAVGLVALALRPQLLAMVFFATTLALLAMRTSRPGLVWSIPLIVAVWANVHGSFFLGPAAVMAAWLGDLVGGRSGTRRLLALAGLSAAATLVGPYGVGVWSYALGVAADPTIRRLITEWQPTAPLSFTGAVFYGSVAGTAAILAAIRWRGGRQGAAPFVRRSWPTLLWLVGLAAIGTFAERGVAWWSIAAPVALAGLLATAAEERAVEPSGATPSSPAPGSLVTTGIVAALLVAIGVLLPVWRGGDPLYGPDGLLTDAPRGITDAVRSEARPGDRIWNAQRWGSWLEFAVPAATVAVDSRIELIPTDAWEDHLALSSGSAGWSTILDNRRVAIVVASATEQRGLIPLMRASPEWRIVHEDRDGVVFARAHARIGPAAGGAIGGRSP